MYMKKNKLSQEELDNFTEEIENIVYDIFSTDKQIYPTLFALVKKEKKNDIAVLDGLGEFFTTEEGKDIAVTTIKTWCSIFKPEVIAFVSEGYAANDPLDTQTVVDPDGNLIEGVIDTSKNPEAKEVLFISFETITKELSVMYEIKRIGPLVEINKIVNTKWVEKESISKKGKFGNLLQKENSPIVQEFLDSQKFRLN